MTSPAVLREQNDARSRRAALEDFAKIVEEQRRRLMKKEHRTRGHYDKNGNWVCGLYQFVKDFWHVLEPGTVFVDGWAVQAICMHLEAVTFGEITNLLINVPPGFMKSLLTDVFWPAWEWGPINLAHLRYVAFSYSASLTQRDNGKFRDLLMSEDYQALYGDRVSLRKIGETKVTNGKHGWKLATSVGGVGTGERGDRIILDDPHNVKESESETVRKETVRWFRESMSSRLNDMERGAKIVIMQRVHEEDVSGTILSLGLDYVHLMIQMEYEWSADPNDEPYATEIGWTDPRWQEDPEDCQDELAWPARFPPETIAKMKKEAGKFAWAGQYQQRPEARGGSIIQRDDWQPWEPLDGKFPPFDYIVGSLDSAYTEAEENDPSAFTVWGIFNHGGFNRAMLVYAWERWLEIQGEQVERHPGEPLMEFKAREREKWGLVEWLNHDCTRLRVNRLLIEDKASGKSVAQTLRKKFQRSRWSVQLMPVAGDKVARVHAIQPMFQNAMIYVPWPLRRWGEKVVDNLAIFPKGKHDDLTDSTSQAVKHLIDIGLLADDDEVRAEMADQARLDNSQKTRPKLPHMR